MSTSSRYQSASITCPNCQTRFVTPIVTIVDAARDPQAKALFLSGQANVAICPQCGHGGVLSTPFVYHDPDKEILYTFVPQQLGLSEFEQERTIGDLTSRVMSSLPPEMRKGYLLQPRRFLSMESLVEAVLEAEGITPVMMQAQRDRADLLGQLLQEADEDARAQIVSENSAKIDMEFFQMLGLNVQLAQAQGLDQVAEELLDLREQLIELTEAGREVADREAAIRELGSEITREGLLDKLIDAALAGKEARIETMVALARPAIDYTFFQQLSAKISGAREAGDVARADTLHALRNTILQITDEIDAEMRRATQEAAAVIEEILHSDDIEQAVRDNLPRIDDLFLSVLARNIDATRQTGREEDAERLQHIADILLQLIQESQPPEIRFINRLIEVEDPAERQAMLDDSPGLVNRELLEIMDMLGDDLNERGRPELAERLAAVRAQVAAMVPSIIQTH
ncbi:MAG: hypothetical protein JXA93_19095 [Anaerolineae bacterium]|nr:hypothetical protein [Anaerolineae bacterium]